MHDGNFTPEEQQLLRRTLLWAIDSAEIPLGEDVDPYTLRVWVCGVFAAVSGLDDVDFVRVRDRLFGPDCPLFREVLRPPPRSDA